MSEPLSDQEKVEMQRLWEEERKARHEYYAARDAATAAVVKRNLAEKKVKAISAKWLVLAERDQNEWKLKGIKS